MTSAPVPTRERPKKWRLILGFVSVLVLAGFWPRPYLASPQWEVWVVNANGEPLAGVNVRLSYQNFSVEYQSHDVALRTDGNGHVIFPLRFERASLWQRVFYTASAARAFVHASFGQHAYVYMAGDGYEASPLSGESSIYWTGGTETMQSRVVAKPIRQ